MAVKVRRAGLTGSGHARVGVERVQRKARHVRGGHGSRMVAPQQKNACLLSI